MKNFIFNIDHGVANFFHHLCDWGGKFFSPLMEGVSFLAEAGILFLVIGIALALFQRTRKIGGTILLSVAIGFLLTNVILKNIIERARPFSDVGSDFYKWWLEAGATNEGDFSFPSGHTTATTAFAVAIFLTTNKKHSWPILITPLLMASSRIYLMVHYFTDCIGGLVVGSISAILAFVVIKWIYRSNIKFFVWARNLELFKSKDKIDNSNSDNQNNK